MHAIRVRNPIQDSPDGGRDTLRFISRRAHGSVTKCQHLESLLNIEGGYESHRKKNEKGEREQESKPTEGHSTLLERDYNHIPNTF